MRTHEVVVNGIARIIADGVTVEALVVDIVPDATGGDAGARPRGVAVAVDDTVVPRGAWTTTVLRSGDRIEILTAVQGG